MMFKKIVSFLIALTPTFSICNAIKMEILEGGCSYIVDTATNEAIVNKIYIPAHTKQIVTIPQYVKDYKGDKYIVRGMQEHAIKGVIHRIESVVLPYNLYETEENHKAYNWFIIHDVPVTVNCTPLEDSKELFKF